MTSPESSGGASSRSADAPPPTVLDRILAETREAIEQRKVSVPREALETRVLAGASSSEGGRFEAALARPGIGVIAEFKRRSPSAGALCDSPDLEAIVRAYERGGASALSILTEGPNFEGSLDDLGAARAACGLPILRKDFIVDPYQLYEARAARADAVLLIAAALDQDALASLHGLAHTLGLDVLVEVHDGEEMARAASVGARLIGINNRDLRDFSCDVRRTYELMEAAPTGATVVSESGIAGAEQVAELERRGVSAVLVGETLMRSPNPRQALEALLAQPVPQGGSAGANGAKSNLL
jgi:indole-3-glycerol phosphate synthase